MEDVKYPFYFVDPGPDDIWNGHGEYAMKGRIEIINPYNNQCKNAQECDATDDKSE